jgi:hypothetical protein
MTYKCTSNRSHNQQDPRFGVLMVVSWWLCPDGCVFWWFCALLVLYPVSCASWWLCVMLVVSPGGCVSCWLFSELFCICSVNRTYNQQATQPTGHTANRTHNHQDTQPSGNTTNKTHNQHDKRLCVLLVVCPDGCVSWWFCALLVVCHDGCVLCWLGVQPSGTDN